MTDNFIKEPGWLVNAALALLAAVGGAYSAVFLGRRRAAVDEQRADIDGAISLSEDERKFRAELRADLNAIKAALVECEAERRACAEREINTHSEIEKLRDEIRDLKARMTQQELPLQARG